MPNAQEKREQSLGHLFRCQRAISPILATLLIIVIVVAAAIAAYAWIQSFSGSQLSAASSAMIVENLRWYDANTIDITVRNIGSVTVTIVKVYIDGVGHAVEQVVQAHAAETLTITYPWTTGQRYKIKVVNSAGLSMEGTYKAPYTETLSIFRMEWGTAIVNDTFQTVDLEKTFVSPIIVCTPHYNSGSPRTVRLIDVSSTSFKIKVQNPSNESLPNTLVSYLVVEEGVWTSPFKIEARKYTTETVGENVGGNEKKNWVYDLRDYGQTYSGNIVILHQVMSYNDPSWISTCVSKSDNRKSPPNSTDSNFRIALNGAEAVASHEAEEVGYIILEEDYDILSSINYEVKQTADSIRGFANSPPYYTSLSQSFSQPPNVIISCQQEVDGGNGGWTIVYTVTESQIGLAIDEDQVRDSERSHATATCGFITFETIGSYEE